MTESSLNKHPLAEQLATLQFTAGLPDGVRDALAETATERCFAVGEYLCREGESTPELFLIANGPGPGSLDEVLARRRLEAG